MGKKKRKIKEDNNEDVMSNKTKIKPDNKEGIAETLSTEKGGRMKSGGEIEIDKVGTSQEHQLSAETVSAKKKKKKPASIIEANVVKEESDSQVNDKPALKKLKVESENASGEVDFKKSDADAVITKKRKKGKKKKHASINEANEVKEESESQVNDEPVLKKLKVESEIASGEVDFKKSDAEAVITKKKRKRGKKKQPAIINEADDVKEESDSQVNGEPVLKKLKVESEIASGEVDFKKSGADAVITKKKKKKGKKKKLASISEADEVKDGSNCQVIGEPILKKLKVDSENSRGEVEIEKLDADVATSKKKRNQHTIINEAIKGKEETKELSLPATNGEGQGKKKKKNKKKKGKVAGENCNVTDIAEPSSDKGKSTNGSLGVSEKLIVGEKSKKEVSSTAKSQKNKNANSGEPSKDSSNKVAISISAKLNEVYDDGPGKEEIIKCWSKSSPLQKDNGCKILSQPFKCMYMPQFLQDASFLNKVKEELSSLEMYKKNNDLYKFKQTSDLKSMSSPYIGTLRKFLYGDFRNWLSDVTGIELNNKVDMSSSRYEYTDVLLCHDDELEGRRVAYILYLTPPWYEKDGGTLDLFDVDNKGQPRDIVESLLPKWNTLAFFEVSPVSFHQVREVLSRDKIRLSINGWFHGPNIKRPSKQVVPPREFLSPVNFDEDEFYAWINPTYLDADTQRQIRKKFQSDSEIELESFICEEKYEELSKAIQSSMKWVGTGPANKQSCKVLKQGKLPGVIAECIKFLKSEALFLILSQLTGLKLHRLAPPDSDPDSEDEEEESKDSNPGVIIDIRQWSHGCYTLLRDCDQEERTSTLDASLFVSVSNKWSLDHGGFTSFIAKDEDEELLTVLPRSNCFALVYRDAETLKFTKYINASVKDLGNKDSIFYELNCMYREG
ncbi:prolyl 3-hydroxylase OGFOD1 [Palaemon carinicauda]|uniref:prolyl 3-hydroxylase OGFOD1 n=1 Tax=Palaemon carinicauda TaxID=392227 RepID=UPI0035B6A797